MRNTAKHDRMGLTTVELVIAVFLLLFLMGIISAVQGRVQAAKGAHTIIEMESILDSARQFYLQNNRWPNNMTEVRTFLPNISLNAGGVAFNIFGNPYNVAPNGVTFTVNTVVPYKSVNAIRSGRFIVVKDNGSADLIQLFSTIPMNTKIGRLQYEKNWGP